MRVGAVTSVGRMWVTEHEGSACCKSFWNQLAWVGDTSVLGLGTWVEVISAYIGVRGLGWRIGLENSCSHAYWDGSFTSCIRGVCRKLVILDHIGPLKDPCIRTGNRWCS